MPLQLVGYKCLHWQIALSISQTLFRITEDGAVHYVWGRVSEYFRPFGALNVLSKNNYVEKIFNRIDKNDW